MRNQWNKGTARFHFNQCFYYLADCFYYLADSYANKHMDNFFLYMCPNCPRKFVHSLTASQHLQKCAPDNNMTDYTVNVRDLSKNIILELIKGVNASMRLSRDETLAGDIAGLKPPGPQTTSTATQTEFLEKPAAGVQTEETLTLSASSQTEEDRMAFHMYTQTEKCKMVTCEIQTEPEPLPSVPQPLVSGDQCPVESSVPGEFVLSERALEVIKLLNSGTSAVPLSETRPHCSETHSLGSETSLESFSSKENKSVHEPKPILRSYEAPRDSRKRKGKAEEKVSSKRSAGNREPFGKSEVHQKVIRCLSPQSHSPSYSMPPMPPGADYKPFNLDNVDMDMSSDTEMGDSPVPVLPRTQKPSVIYRLIPMERSVAVGRKHHLAYHLERNIRKKAEVRKQLLESSDRFRKPSSEEQKETKTQSTSF